MLCRFSGRPDTRPLRVDLRPLARQAQGEPFATRTQDALMSVANTEGAFRRYEAARARLPTTRFPQTSRSVTDLSETLDDFDLFVLDGFGVLNVGESAVEGAAARVAQLRAAGKSVLVLTNGATSALPDALAKYQRLGFDFSADEVISSRAVMVEALAAFPADIVWGVSAMGAASLKALPVRTVPLLDDPAPYRNADAFLLLSTGDWSERRQAFLADALGARTRPVLVANPDIVAPFESGFSLEPGLFAHDLADAGLAVPQFYGKPFANAFSFVLARIGKGAPPAERIAMVGDTLHTDILGGAAAGWSTVLVASHGLFRGHDVAPYIAASGIVPTVIAHTT